MRKGETDNYWNHKKAMMQSFKKKSKGKKHSFSIWKPPVKLLILLDGYAKTPLPRESLSMISSPPYENESIYNVCSSRDQDINTLSHRWSVSGRGWESKICSKLSLPTAIWVTDQKFTIRKNEDSGSSKKSSFLKILT